MDAHSDQCLCYSQTMKAGFLTSRFLGGRGQIYFCYLLLLFFASSCILIRLYWSTKPQLSHILITQMTCFSGSEFCMPCINRFLAYCKGGNFNIHIWHGSAISSSKQGKSGSIFNLVKNNKAVWAVQACMHFMKILTVYTLNSHLLTLNAHTHKMYVFVVYKNICSLIDTQCGPRSDCSFRTQCLPLCLC